MDKITVLNGEITYGELRFFCCIGRDGLTENKKEGDFKTPKGIFPIREIYYRKDKLEQFNCVYKLNEINKDMGWCDDPNSQFYNKPIVLPSEFHHENLWREDNLYNIIVVLGYNDDPVVKNAGSAIFLHIADNIKYTEGCVAVEQEYLIKLLGQITKNTVLEIK
jgi:L,D-peptidoglycan transpeptidase YkuD (ErfK/YbiS/YcfS/YnhG family)